MKMLSLDISGNVRLLLAKISRIKINFESDCQTVIGTNGSGKSTLLRAASPLPAETNDYQKGGHEIKVFEHRGEKYKAASYCLGKSWEHSFIRLSDNEELNTGKTKRVQEQLVEQITGLTPWLFDILTGDVTFTQMSPAKRRECILSFSGSDLEYAMKVYRDLNKRHMDSIALQKHYAKRLATETETIISDDELNELNRMSRLYTDQINALTMERTSFGLGNRVDQNSIESTLSGFLRYVQAVDKADFSLPKSLVGLVNDPDDIPMVRYDLNNRIDSSQRDLNVLFDEQAKVQECLNIFMNNGMQGLGDMVRLNESYRNEMKQIREDIQYHLDVNAPQQASGALSSILTDLVTILNSLPTNMAEFEETTIKKQSEQRIAMDLLSKRQSELNQLDHKFYHINNIEVMNCPQCSHRFQPGVDVEQVQRLEQNYTEVKNAVEQLTAKLEELNIFIGESQNYQRSLNTLNMMMNQIGVLGPMWNHIRKHMDSNEPPAFLMGYVHAYAADLELSIQYQRIEKELAANEIIISNARAISEGQDDLNRERLDVLTLRSNQLMTELRDLRLKLEQLNSFESSMNYLMKNVQGMFDSSDKLTAEVGEFIEHTRHDSLGEDIAELQTRVAEIQGKIANGNTVRALIEELRKNKEIADEEATTHKVLVDALCPKNGLIAERIRSYFDGFIGQMNALIEEVWTYAMKIMGSGIEDALDCKFPLESEGEGSNGTIKVVSPDIAKSSSSQTDFINFSFRLVTMMSMGLEEYPLYLDETCVRMDEKHRDRFNGLIERILEHRRASQVFLISHYAAVHGVFTNAQVTVIDKSNIITLPQDYNDHVEIEYC